MLDGFPSNGSQAKESGAILMTAQEPKQYSSESDRWYDPITQKSVNDCLSEKGLPKRVTLREARRENYIPSVTTILHNLSKPGLERWKVLQYLGVAHRSKDLHWTEEEWIKEVIRVADQEMDVAKDRGQDIHGKIDRWLEAGMPEPQCAHTKAARTALDRLGCAEYPMEIEKTFAVQCGDAWVAGKCDLHSADQRIIVDWKSSKSPCDGTEKLGWDEHIIQLASYSMALFGKFVPCYNVFVSTSVDGAFEIVGWNHADMERGWSMYCHAYHLWCLAKNFVPSRKLSQTAQSS